MKNFLVSLVFLSLLSGCATTHMVQVNIPPQLSPSADKATLVVIRDTSLGGAIVFWNYLDRKLIGETKGRSFFVTQVAPGPHYVIVATENACAAHFDFKAGKTYFLGEGVAIGIWRARTSGFYPMTKKDAENAMKSASHLQLNPKTAREDMAPDLYRQAINDYLSDVKNNPDSYKNILKYDGVVVE